MSISENSRYISLSPENGSEFVAGQKIQFNVKPNISFIKGKDSYISVDIENTSSNSIVAHPPLMAGASGWIERMDIFSLESGQLLESLTNYNVWAGIENQYLNESADQLTIKEGCIEPLRAHINNVAADTKASTRSLQEIVAGETGSSRLSTISTTGVKQFRTRKFCIPIKSGVFNHWSQEEKLTPNLLYGGLRVELTPARNEHALSRVASQDGTGVAYNLSNFAGGVPIVNVNNTKTFTSRAVFTSAQLGGFVVGNRIRLDKAAADINLTRNIVSVTITATKLTIVVDGANITEQPGTNDLRIFHPETDKISYKLKNVELKVLEVIPPPAMMKQVIKESQVDFISYETFLDNLSATSLQHQTEFPSVATKAKAIFTHYVDDVHANSEITPTHYAGQGPTDTKLNSVQYFINNKLYPLKAYNPDRLHDRIVAYNEIVKAMKACGLNVKRLGDSRGAHMSDYSFTYLTARELARGADFVYPLKDAEAQLRTEYSAGRTGNTKLINFVFSVKSVMIESNSLSVVM